MAEKLQKHRKAALAGLLIWTVIFDGCVFPVVQFTPGHPGSALLYVLVFIMAISYHGSLGKFEAVLLPKWKGFAIGALNAALVLGGLLFRYVLEFGEVSNTYNFTVPNVAFHLIVLTLISTADCLWEQKKNSREG